MSLTVAARVVFDSDERPERLPLYADGPLEVTGRHTGRVPAGRSVSFAAYFNAFPAWHWAEYTDVARVELSIDLAGAGILTVLRSDGEGVGSEIARREFAGRLQESLQIELEPNIRGGWLWFDIESGVEAVELRSAHWQVDAEPRETRLATLAMTTMDKPDFALGVLRRIAGEPAALAALDAVIVIDQGKRKVVDDPALASTRSALDGRLRIIDQQNFGGSGGFSRGMLEVVSGGRSGSVILLDDDVELEPEALARAVAFASFTTKPTIVGGHFFDLNRPLQLHAWTEGINLDRFDWGPVGDAPVDFASTTLRGAPWLHKPAKPDYNGWWCCLIPVDIIKKIGLSLPSFLKWDDAEYSLRAAAAGFDTVSLPGMAVWHITWLDKNDALGWQAFYHARNRLVAALVDARHPGHRLPRVNLNLDVRFLVTMDYHVAELRHLAYESIFAGPGTLHPELGTRLGEVLSTMRQYPSGNTVPIDEAAPRFEETGHVRGIGGLRAIVISSWLMARHMVTRAASVPQEAEARVGFSDARWWRIGRYRHVLAVSSDNLAYQRHLVDPAATRRMLRRAISDHRRMRREWDRLGGEYRAALPELTSVETWRRTLGLTAPAEL